MATTAAVYFEGSEKTIFVGLDGYPEHMVPTLSKLIAAGELESVTEHSDYLFLGEGYAKSTAAAGQVIRQGVLFREQGESLRMEHDSFTHAPMFYEGETFISPDHKYTVTSGGQVVAHHRY